MESEVVVADNLAQQLVFLGLDLLIAVFIYLICYWFYKYGKNYEIIRKFIALPIVQHLLKDIQTILTNLAKIKIKKKMKEHKVGEEPSDVQDAIPPELIKKYGDSVKSLSKDSIEKLKQMNGL